MSNDEEIAKLVDTIKGFKPGGALKNYITHITFPKFKSIECGATVNFDFAFTALVGANGIGKSSALHALWGAPFGYSTSKFWFATELDPIEGSSRDPQRFFYGHWNESYKGVVETRKARIGKKRGSDYWEPYRSSTRDGMRPLPEGKYEGKAKDRWNPVKRTCVYINLKTTFGSFDRYFYFDDGISGGGRRDTMLREAKRLKQIVLGDRKSYKLGGGRERLFENRLLTKDELAHVSRILGRDYTSARLVRHSLYPGNRGEDLSVIFNRGAEYSEAFAGSGEIAAVSAVVQILGAPPGSLILLDEPETSLHPGAQRALLRFLLERIKHDKHQVVVSTHSMEFLRGLPQNAIKVFEDNGAGRTRILPESSSWAALKRLGKPPEDVRRVLVEDPIAAMIVKHAARGLDPGDAEALEVRVAPGGADAILAYLGPSAMMSGDNVFVLLDGDKRKVPEFTDPAGVPPARHPELEELLKQEIGVKPILHIPGGADQAGHENAKIDAQLGYLRWLRSRLSYLPTSTPEHLILEAIDRGGSLSGKSSGEVKDAFKTHLAEDLDVLLSSEDIIGLAKVTIAKISQSNPHIVAIREKLRAWLHS
ncbi:ATP-dependent endonuclease [Luteimonas soli]|uniref:ATP-dependent endonuclease n=1 Tax=Luteimonas soli TaxID=1648966 RepID=A0ABV7XNB4_9GAMM